VSTSTASAPSVRCPACSAYVRAGSEWCTLCYADLRPPPDPAPESPIEPPPDAAPIAAADVPADAGSVEDVEEVEPPVAGLAAPAAPEPRGKHAKHAKPAAEAPAFGEPTQVVDGTQIEAIAEQMLAQLAGQRDNPLGKLSGIVDTKAKQVALMVGGGIAAGCLLFLLMALLGSFV
jgi:hypothetical protein